MSADTDVDVDELLKRLKLIGSESLDMSVCSVCRDSTKAIKELLEKRKAQSDVDMSKTRITMNRYASADENFNWARDAVVTVWYRKNKDNSITTMHADADLADENNKDITCENCQQSSMTKDWGSDTDWAQADNVKCPHCNSIVYSS